VRHYERAMLKLYVLNGLAEPFPGKCQILNSILQTCSSKDLYTCVEILIDCIFVNYATPNNQYYLSDINNNNGGGSNANIGLSRLYYGNYAYDASSANECGKIASWRLKTISRTTSIGSEYEHIYGFLCTSSPFWLSLFKLEAMGARYTLACSLLPVC
jgi:hypothetical protein